MAGAPRTAIDRIASATASAVVHRSQACSAGRRRWSRTSRAPSCHLSAAVSTALTLLDQAGLLQVLARHLRWRLLVEVDAGVELGHGRVGQATLRLAHHVPA